MRTFILEVRTGHEQRRVEADSWEQSDDWLIFFRNNPCGGRPREYWRFQVAEVVSMGTRP